MSSPLGLPLRGYGSSGNSTIEMKTEILNADHPIVYRHAVDILKNGGVVAFPTDTVYGLAALPWRDDFVERLYIVKGRGSERAIAVLISHLSELEQIADSLNDHARILAQHFWPGPLTIVVPKRAELSRVLSPHGTVGVRMPNHPVALKLLQSAGPLAVTSANLSGQANTTNAQEVLAQLGGRIDLIIDGGIAPGGVPSTVVDCTGEDLIILREGPISLEAMQAILSGVPD